MLSARVMNRLLTLCLLLVMTGCDCGKGRVVGANNGAIQVNLIGVEPEGVTLAVAAIGPASTQEKSDLIATLPFALRIEQLMPATYVVRASSVSSAGATLQTVEQPGVMVSTGGVTEVTIDLSKRQVMVPAESCDGVDNDEDGEIDEALDLPICVLCQAGVMTGAGDDARCGAIPCSGLDHVDVHGDLSPGGEATCVANRHGPMTTARCAGPQACAAPNGPFCPEGSDTVLATKRVCESMINCESGRPVIDRVTNGTPCGSQKICDNGACVVIDAGVIDAGVPEVDAGVTDRFGCADGTREGFQSLSAYPAIAGCSGAWTIPGVTAASAPGCGRASGNTGTNREGVGCASADLCSAGWHLCRGKDEVAAKANNSCADAVPAGAPANSLFFAVVQNSVNNTTCDSSTSSNDVFGCGNLGIQLQAAKNCGPLTRALASTQAGSCGFNQAEPNLGPWQCVGGTMSHLAEGSIVTKSGCPNSSCQYDGNAIGNADKGGVLCCRD